MRFGSTRISLNVTRSLLIIPVSIVLVAMAGLGLCNVIGWNPGTSGPVVAAVGCLLAGELALVPLVLARESSQAGIAQAGLLGTVIHLFISAGLAGVVLMLKLDVSASFVYWLCAFYWVTLIVLVILFTRCVRNASATTPSATKP